MAWYQYYNCSLLLKSKATFSERLQPFDHTSPNRLHGPCTTVVAILLRRLEVLCSNIDREIFQFYTVYLSFSAIVTSMRPPALPSAPPHFGVNYSAPNVTALLTKMWKEMVVAKFKVQSRHFPVVTEKNHDIRKTISLPRFHTASTKYKTQTLLICPRHYESTDWATAAGWRSYIFCSWLRHCAASRKVAGSIPDGVTGIFCWHNPSVRTVAPGSTQPLTEMSTKNISWEVKLAGALGWQPYHLHVPIVMKSESLHHLETSGPVQACTGIVLPLLYQLSYPGFLKCSLLFPWKHTGNCMYHRFNIQRFCLLPTQFILVFCVDLRTNSNYFPIQH